jgi:putative membrane protein
MTLAELLPTVNAALNLVSATLLFAGWRAIRRGDRERHRQLMLAAVSSSALFLVSYLTRVALTGTHRFPDDGALRAVYLVVLLTHTVLAAAAASLLAPPPPPLVLRTVFLSLRDRIGEHRRIARWTLPIWMYVSVTGVVVYVMLYHLAPRVQ